MTTLFDEYYWKNGIPKGVNVPGSCNTIKYKIVSDPYFKHITVEKYLEDEFVQIIYDSRLIDFRHLAPAEHLGWEKITLSSNENQAECLIRDHHDRVVFKEIHSFSKGLCTGCSIYSPHEWLVAKTKISYTELGDDTNQLKLFDSNHHPVMVKTYEWDPLNRQFSTLLNEQKDWSFQGVL